MTVYTFLYAAMLIAWPVYAIVSRICSCIETKGLYERAEKMEETEDDEEEEFDDSEDEEELADVYYEEEDT